MRIPRNLEPKHNPERTKEMNYTDTFTTNENTTDGEVLDRLYDLIYRTELTDERKLHFVTLTLEWAKETN